MEAIMTAIKKTRGDEAALRKARMLIGGTWVESAAAEGARGRSSVVGLLLIMSAIGTVNLADVREIRMLRNRRDTR
jgi:hypothetical protein